MNCSEMVLTWARKWRGLVIAGSIALLSLESSVAVGAAASGGPGRDRASSSRPNRVARVAPNLRPSVRVIVPDPPGTVPGYTTFKVLDGNQLMLKSLKANALSFSKVLGGGIVQAAVLQGFGWVLQQWGVGTGIEDQIAEIGHKLNQIQTSLHAIEASTARLREEMADSTLANLVNQAAPIVAHVNTGMKDLDFIAHLPAHDPTKHKLTEHLLTFIHKDLLFGKQLELADRIGGTAGAHGLIKAAYNVALAHHRLWTLRTSQQVREVVAYYQAAEVRLLTLRVEYMHAHPGTYSGKYIEAATESVDEMVRKQSAELKPEPGPEVIADTRSKLEWLASGLTYQATIDKARTFAADVGSTGLFPVPTYSKGPGGIKIVTGFVHYDVGKGWRLPDAAEATQFIAGWSDPSGSWLKWLRREAPGLGAAIADAPNGVWTSTIVGKHAIGLDAAGILRPDIYFNTHRSPFLVRTKAAHYW